MRTLIEGEARDGYIITEGYDLPPLNFDREEIEAMVLRLSLFSRARDKTLQLVARRVPSKVDAAKRPADMLTVSKRRIEEVDPAITGLLRSNVGNERTVEIIFSDLRRF